jgi:hypothetical protein
MTADTVYLWFQIVQTAVMGLVGVLLVAMRAGMWSGQKLTDLDDLAKRIAAIEGRLDRAGQAMSDLGDQIQKIPEALRGIFVARDGAELARLATQIEHQSKQTAELWLHVNELKRRP